jgi:hypothetical protein
MLAIQKNYVVTVLNIGDKKTNLSVNYFLNILSGNLIPDENTEKSSATVTT